MSLNLIRIACLLLRAELDSLPGRYTPIPVAALVCATLALLISLPMVALMQANLAGMLVGLIITGAAAQLSAICPFFLLPKRCDRGLHGALAGVGALILLGAALSLLVLQQTHQ